MQEVPVGSVDLDDIDARVDRALRRRRPLPDDLPYFFLRELLRLLHDLLRAFLQRRLELLVHHPRLLQVALLVRVRGRGEHLLRPSTVRLRDDRVRREPQWRGRALAPGVPELDTDLLPLAVRKLHELAEGRDLRVGPQPAVVQRAAALWGHSGRLDDRKAWAAQDDRAHYLFIEVMGEKST